MKNTLIRTHCKRCGCSLTMLKHSIFGANSLKAELGQICAECLTPEENHRIRGQFGYRELLYGKPVF